MSFRYKLILGVVSIQGILLAVLVWNGLHSLKVSNEEEFLRRVNLTAHLFAVSTQSAVLSTDLATLEAAVRWIESDPGIVYARVFGDGQVLAQAGQTAFLNREFVPSTDLDDARDGVFDKSAVIAVAGTEYGRIELGFSVESITGVLKQARDRTLLLTLVGLALILLSALLIGLYVTRRLHFLRQASSSIAEGRFDYRIEVRGRDELAQTAQAFNDMSDRLKQLDEQRSQAEAATRALNLDLERRVHQRTDDLAKLNTELKHQALHDALTHLPNRTLFTDRLEQAIRVGTREKSRFALVIIDLDLFKEINDTRGHHAGDLVLQEVARRVRGVLRDSDTVARMGGDEFAILLLNVVNTEMALFLCQRIHESICESYLLEGQAVDIGASMGIALFSEHGTQAEVLTRHADAAMYTAKQNKSGIRIYDEVMDRTGLEQVSRKRELRLAIASKQLILHFQPKFDLRSGAINGIEALVRWQHPQRGLIFPDDFIPLAEESGTITPLTQEVLRLALAQCRQWMDAGMPLPVAVNISAINLQDPEFPVLVAEQLRAAEVPARMLELEVTETAFMSKPLLAMENIARLSSLGVEVSIDDFGTGYSSMAYIKKLMVTKIKIDKSFVMDMHQNHNDEVIVRSTIDLGHNLGLKVIAEGVENQQSWDRLKALGCDIAQGYLMSKPLPADRFNQWYAGLAEPGMDAPLTKALPPYDGGRPGEAPADA